MLQFKTNKICSIESTLNKSYGFHIVLMIQPEHAVRVGSLKHSLLDPRSGRHPAGSLMLGRGSFQTQ